MGIKHLSDDEKKEFLKELFSSFSAEDLKNAIAAAAESIDPEPVPTISAREAEIQEKLARLKAKGTGSNK